MDFCILELNLISAQGLKPPAGSLRRLQAFAVAWADPAAKLRTLPDRLYGENPTWNERLLFKIPARSLAADSPSALSVEIYAATAWPLSAPLIGSVRILLGNHRLLDQPSDVPSFAALGVRRPSGRFHGVLNVAATLLKRIPAVAAEALEETSAVAYRDLMAPPPAARRPVLRERNREEERADLEEGSDDMGALCGIGFQRKIHLSPSDEKLKTGSNGKRPAR